MAHTMILWLVSNLDTFANGSILYTLSFRFSVPYIKFPDMWSPSSTRGLAFI